VGYARDFIDPLRKNVGSWQKGIRPRNIPWSPIICLTDERLFLNLSPSSYMEWDSRDLSTLSFLKALMFLFSEMRAAQLVPFSNKNNSLKGI